ncbi:acid-sensing ion channel 4-B-like [Neocloeon triangulifer]|uniref:acid-sensing ion channel 4-B-like n=1 Tax=Neocloeon triangulifer TaxID=2078957 RepID=UPI00286F3E35|nr:acid-sensing ion channel 4-B-like [Neocloeon triangulifer]
MDQSFERVMTTLEKYYQQKRSTMTSSDSIIWPPPDLPGDLWTSPPDPNKPPLRKAWLQAKEKSTAKLATNNENISTRGKGKQRTLAWRSFKQVSVAGIDAALDRHSPLLRRLLWGCVLIICMTLMMAQCLNRVYRYLEEPVNVNVRVTHNQSLEYPSVTVCNRNSFNVTAALEMLIENKLLPPQATEKDANISNLVGVNGLTPTKIWERLAHNMDVFVTECWFGRGTRCRSQGVWMLVHTVTGPCLTYRLNYSHVHFVGSFHNLYLKLWESTPKIEDWGFRIHVHEASEVPILTSRTHAMTAELGWSREVKMELRKFNTLSTAKSPCNNHKGYSLAQCQLDCFQAFMLEQSGCRMPYMTEKYSNLSECATPDEYQAAMNAMQSLLISGGWSANTCNCPQQCRQTAFQMYPENIAFETDRVKLRIFYEDLVYEQITEDIAYNLIALLCDIGGTLGLLMGASVLTMCELLEVLWSRFMQTCCQSTNPSANGRRRKKRKISTVAERV